MRRYRGESLHDWVARNIAPPDANGCRLWLKAKNPKGYGVVSTASTKVSQVSRVIWEQTHGPIPPGLLVCHRCDVRACCEVTHLFLGTPADNSRDRCDKNRGTRGEATWSARLTEADVRAIRAQRAAGAYQVDLAADYGVNEATISNICTRTTWGHVE